MHDTWMDLHACMDQQTEGGSRALACTHARMRAAAPGFPGADLCTFLHAQGGGAQGRWLACLHKRSTVPGGVRLPRTDMGKEGAGRVAHGVHMRWQPGEWLACMDDFWAGGALSHTYQPCAPTM